MLVQGLLCLRPADCSSDSLLSVVDKESLVPLLCGVLFQMDSFVCFVFCAFVCACTRVCVRACTRVCVCLCGCMCVCIYAIIICLER